MEEQGGLTSIPINNELSVRERAFAKAVVTAYKHLPALPVRHKVHIFEEDIGELLSVVKTSEGDRIVTRNGRIIDIDSGRTVKYFTSKGVCAAVSSDGLYILFTRRCNKSVFIDVWKTDTEILVHSILDDFTVESLFVNSQRGIIIGDRGGEEQNKVIIWSLETGNILYVYEGKSWYVDFISMAPDGKTAIIKDSKMIVLNTETGKQWMTLEQNIKDAVIAGGKLVTNDHNGDVYIWDLNTATLLEILSTENANRISMDITPDGKRLVVDLWYNWDVLNPQLELKRIIRVYDLETHKLLYDSSEYQNEKNLNKIERMKPIDRNSCISTDGTKVLVHFYAQYRDYFRVYEVAQGDEIGRFCIEGTKHRGSAHKIALTSDGGKAVISIYPNIIQVWNTATIVQEYELNGPVEQWRAVEQWLGDGRQFILNNNKLVFLSRTAMQDFSDNPGKVKMWDLTNGETKVNSENEFRWAFGKYFTDLSFDGYTVFIRFWDGIWIVDSLTGKKLRWIESVHSVSINAIPNSKWIVAGESSEVVIWNSETGEEVSRLQGHKDRVYAIAVSPNGERIASESFSEEKRKCEIRIWKTNSGKLMSLWNFNCESFCSLSFTCDGAGIIAKGFSSIKIFDTETGELKHDLFFKTKMDYIAVDSGIQNIISASNDEGKVQIWDIKTGDLLLTIDIEGKIVLSNDDKVFIAESTYKLNLWDWKTGRLLGFAYNLDNGFLWTTPPDEYAPNGYIWTDRTELITVWECDKQTGKNQRILAENDPKRREYLALYNDQQMVMARINDYQKYVRLNQKRNRVKEYNDFLAKVDQRQLGEIGRNLLISPN